MTIPVHHYDPYTVPHADHAYILAGCVLHMTESGEYTPLGTVTIINPIPFFDGVITLDDNAVYHYQTDEDIWIIEETEDEEYLSRY